MNVSVDRISFQTAARDNYCPGVCFPDFSAHSFPGCVKSPKVIHRHFDEQQSSRNSLFPYTSIGYYLEFTGGENTYYGYLDGGYSHIEYGDEIVFEVMQDEGFVKLFARVAE